MADAQATATGLANKAYQTVPEGTAATIQGYVGAAVQKAQEVLPPALGGSTVSRHCIAFMSVGTQLTYIDVDHRQHWCWRARQAPFATRL